MKNEDIISKIKAGITDATHADLVKTPIDFKFKNGTLVMEGTVNGIFIKKKAFLIAKGVVGQDGVIDKIRVKPASRMGDLEIATHIQEAIGQENTLEDTNIEIEVGTGVVYLEGEVHSLAQKRLAEVLAWWVPGSVEVINNLKVIPIERDSDDEITDTVKLVFERDKLVKDSNSGIRVKTKNAFVTLTGIVKSTAAKDAAEDDAWYVAGVRDVINHLEVG